MQFYAPQGRGRGLEELIIHTQHTQKKRVFVCAGPGGPGRGVPLVLFTPRANTSSSRRIFDTAVTAGDPKSLCHGLAGESLLGGPQPSGSLAQAFGV